MLPGPRPCSGAGRGDMEGAGGGDQPNPLSHPTEEIKGLLAALQPGDGAAHAEGETQYLAGGNPEPPAEGEEDLYTAPEPVAATEPEPELELEEGEPRGPADGGEKLPGAELGSSADEEAQLLLAIQQSMDSQHEEEEQLQRATELSLRSYCRESEPGAVGLAAALEASLEEALEVADAARVTVYTAYEQDVSALLSQLEQALEAQLREEVVSSEQLRALPAPCRGYLVQLQCRHAVRLSLAGATATLHGFAEYPVAASRDLARLLHRLLPAERPQDGAGARWLHWDTPDTPVPYTAEASALLEEAWRRRQRQLDVLFDGRPFTVDFERMEEYDIGSARARPIARDLPPGKLPSSPPGACTRPVGARGVQRGAGHGGGGCRRLSPGAGGAGAGGRDCQGLTWVVRSGGRCAPGRGGEAGAPGRGLGGVSGHGAQLLRHAGQLPQQDPRD